MPHPSRLKTSKPRPSPTSPRSNKAWIALGASWSTAFVAAVSLFGVVVYGGCSDPETGSSGFNTTSGGGATSSTSTNSGMGGASTFNPTTADASSGSNTGSSSGNLNCDKDPLTTGAPVWSKTSKGTEGEYPTSIAIDAMGNTYLSGSFTGAVDFGGGMLSSSGDTDVYLVKLDPTGAHVWSKKFGGPNTQSALGVGVDKTGNVYIAGNFLGSIDLGSGSFSAKGVLFEDVFVAKYDKDGSPIWSKAFGSADTEHVSGLAVDSAGNPIVTGTFQSTVSFGGANLTTSGGGSSDIYVVKFDPAGAHIWSKSFGDAADQVPGAIVVDAADNLVLTGKSKGSVDFGGGPLTGVGVGDVAFLAKLSSSGAHVFSHVFGDGARGTALDTNPVGDIVVVGDYKGTIDIGGGTMKSKANENAFVGRFDSAGKYVWGLTFGSSASHAAGVVFASKDKVVVGGYFNGAVDLGKSPGIASAGSFDGFLVKLDSAGCYIWGRGFGDAVYQDSVGLVIDATDNVTLMGRFAGAVDFGSGVLTAVNDDLYVAKYAP